MTDQERSLGIKNPQDLWWNKGRLTEQFRWLYGSVWNLPVGFGPRWWQKAIALRLLSLWSKRKCQPARF